MNNALKRALAIISLFSLVSPLAAQALEIDYDHIISDAEAEDYDSMGQMDIKNFLKEKDSYLKNFFYSGNNPAPSQLALDPDVKYIKTRSATEIIYNAAQEAKINPKFLLTMLQKEQGLIESDNPTERALDFAMGYYCFDGDYCNPRYKGFGKQVRSMALQFRWYMDNIEDYDYQPGETVCIDDPYPYLPCTSEGTEVTPANKITAAMYVYTPHIHGNKLFATLWDKYGFGGSTPDELPDDVGIIPDGALVKAKDSDDGAIYLIHNGEKRPFASMTALVSRYDPDKVLNIAQEEIDKYELGDLITHTNYSVLEGLEGKKYLIDGLYKRLITSDEVFRQLGFNPDEVIEVSSDDLAYYQDGVDLDSTEASPFAELLQDADTGSIYYVKDGLKSTIIDEFILEANFPDMAIRKVSSDELATISSGAPMKLADGTLIKIEYDSRVYVISNGYRRLIPDGETFEAMGYNWGQIHTVSKKILNFHFVGEQLASQ